MINLFVNLILKSIELILKQQIQNVYTALPYVSCVYIKHIIILYYYFLINLVQIPLVKIKRFIN